MYITPLNFDKVLERFYDEREYDFMLLFVSSFDNNDKAIIKEIVDNAIRIDRITGDKIVFFYFIKETYDRMNENLVRWVKNIDSWEPLYGEGVKITMETADDICHRFHIFRSDLPAFILVSKDPYRSPKILPVRNYNDFERFLTSLNHLHAYMEDREIITSR